MPDAPRSPSAPTFCFVEKEQHGVTADPRPIQKRGVRSGELCSRPIIRKSSDRRPRGTESIARICGGAYDAAIANVRPNVFADTFSLERYGLRAEQVVRNAGGEMLGGTLYEVAPGHEGVPLHIHHGMEELVVVIAGRPTLRTLEGESELAPGDVVGFPRGRRGAHTLVNRGDEPARYLMISTKVMPEVVEYPEEGTVRMLTRAPLDPPKPGDDPDDRLNLRFNRSDAID
jgi:uncharacterized cupin superfamily protein